MTENFTERLKNVSTVLEIPTSSNAGNSLWKREVVFNFIVIFNFTIIFHFLKIAIHFQCDQFIGQCSKKIIEREDLSAQYNKLKCILELSLKSRKPS